ncbi:MAG: hypothetical protein JRI76_13925 [Deltaproteobacteria bacterium]|nr:hypothetical protein [Deltaproteobacteria bacterium]MBW1956654.1 hypothetical protein [Deltaproteobacteria bacterium]MBW2043103.1 hypothetical protein [Deltaproteobacteria bacterium]
MTLPLTEELIEKAESFPDIQAGIARLADVLQAPSYGVSSTKDTAAAPPEGDTAVQRPPWAVSVLVLGLSHPPERPELDWWEAGNTAGNRRLKEISEELTRWMKSRFASRALPLPYHVERGGVFLKDAAVISGLGVIGENNLLVNPVWGPRIRLRAVLVEGDLEPTGPLNGFSPCASCEKPCHGACPRIAFGEGVYARKRCGVQMNADVKAARQNIESGRSSDVPISYCRECELACPVGL